MTIKNEELMEAMGLAESDREEIRAFREFMVLRDEWRRTRTDEAWRRYKEAIERASRGGRRA